MRREQISSERFARRDARCTWLAVEVVINDTGLLTTIREDMMKQSLTIDYGDDVLLALDMSPEQFCGEAKILIAVKLHEMGRLSTGAAAELADIPKPLFLAKLADYGIDTFDVSADELRRDLANARRHL